MTARPTYLRLAAFVGGTLLAGFLIGYFSNPQPVYARLIKPDFAPPASVFGPVWSLLYIMIAIVGWRLSERRPQSVETRAWWTQLVLNLAWSPVFFLIEWRTIALLIIVALLIMIVTLIGRIWNRDRTSALLLVPYALWVAFATALNAAIVYLN